MNDEQPDLGTCCTCGSSENVHNIIMLNKKTPKPGFGWGCLVCNLPNDGAVAVLCDACLDAGKRIRFACVGYAKDNQRIAISQLTEPYEHNMRKHKYER